MSLYFSHNCMKLTVSVRKRERNRDRETKTHGELEGLGRYYIDAYFLLSRVVPYNSFT